MRTKIFLGTLLILACVGITLYYLEPRQQESTFNTNVLISETTINTEIVKNAKEKSVGLSKYKNLAENQGMLFVIDPPTRPGFWMKGMSFPIDIIWIKNNKVIGFEENLSPCTTTCPTFSPKEKIDYALETKAGFVKENQIKVGDSFNYETN